MLVETENIDFSTLRLAVQSQQVDLTDELSNKLLDTETKDKIALIT